MSRLFAEDPLLEQEEHQELKRRIEEYLGSNYEKLNL